MSQPADPRLQPVPEVAGDAGDGFVPAHPPGEDGGPAVGIFGAATPYGADTASDLAVGVAVLRDLIRIEVRPDRVRRILRIWESKVSTAIRTRHMEAAEEWMKAVTVDPVVPPEHADAVAASLAALSRPALIDELLLWVVNAEAIEQASGLFSEWGEPVVRRIVDLMAVDDPPVGRRHLLEVLAVIGRTDTRLLVGHIADHRWFIVRNLAIALGRSGRLAAIPPLRSLGGHQDPRVRVEALRGLATIDADACAADLAGGYQDPDRRVRQAAVSLLRACPSREVVPRLVDLIRNGRLGLLEAERLVELIGERREAAAQAALEELAARRRRGGVPRAIRRIARLQLERRAP